MTSPILPTGPVPHPERTSFFMYRNPFAKLFPWLLLFLTVHLQAQNAISLRWDKEVGCQAVAPQEDEEDRKYEELVESNTCLRVCENATITYSLVSDDNSNWVSTVWDVTGGTITAQATGSCTVTWGTFGSGSIGATITTPAGEESLPDLCIEIIRGPIAKFELMPSTGATYDACKDEELYFINRSEANGGSEIISYLWDFGDGTYSSEQDPVHSYGGIGSYEVRLTVTNACKCTKTSSRVTVNVKGTGISIECPGVLCEGDLATYSLSGSIGSRCRGIYDWSVVGGTILSPIPYTNTIKVIWDHIPDSGFGLVKFDATECTIPCPVATTVRIPVIRDNIPISGETSICPGTQYRYTLPKWPSTDVVWSLSDDDVKLLYTDQPNEVIIALPARISDRRIVLSATYQNTLLNCGGTATLSIDIHHPISISGPRKVCPGNVPYTVLGFSDPAGKHWSLQNSGGTIIQSGTGNTFTANLGVAGTYTLTLNALGFCTSAPIKIQVTNPPAVPAETTVFGKRVVCPGVPEHYRIENDVPGTVIGWAAESGSFAGSNYGNDVTITFNPVFTGDYSLIIWREYNSEPYCQSERLVIPISRPYVDVKITGAGTGAANAATPCPSSYQEYAVVRQDDDTAYTDGEVYNWSIQDPEVGSVGAVDGMPDSGDGTPNISVLWNEFPMLTTTKLILRIRKCGAFLPPVTFDITINPTEELTIEVPETLCSGQFFVPVLTPPTDGEVTWYVDGNEWEDNDILITDASPGDHTHVLKASVTGINGCPAVYEFTKEITVHEVPQGQVTPGGIHSFCETVVPIALSVYPTQPGGTTITWYKDSGAAGTGATYTVTDFGNYWAVLDNGNCETVTNYIQVVERCGGGVGDGCITAEPVPAIALTAVQQDGCGTIKLTASNLGSYTGTPQWLHQGATCECFGSEVSSSATAAEYLFTKPDQYFFTYVTSYASTTPGVDCVVSKDITAIIPYIAKLEYKVSCDGPEGYYSVLLMDRSPFYAGTPYDRREFFVDGVSQGIITTGTTEITNDLAPGPHTLRIKIWRSANDYDPCEYTTALDLPGFPDATFTYTSATCDSSCGEVCSNKSIQLHVTNPHPGETYEWDFGDAINTQQDPIKVYTVFGGKTIILKVSNEYGCESTFFKSIEVQQNLLNGQISVTPSINCEGTTTLMAYNNLGLSTPTHFIWMNGTSIVPLSTDTSTLSVDKSGAYWVKTRDAKGCTSETGTQNATFVMVPDAQIIGPNAVCIGQQFTLTGYAGGATTEYAWVVDGVASDFSTSNAALNQVLDGSVTPVTYTLRIRVPKGGGQYCMTETTKTIDVLGPPDPPYIVIDNVSCSPYTITLHAYSVSGSGTFNWSNGASTAADTESVIDVSEGGPFQVRFTNEAGCSATAQIEAPKDPDTFLWLFPSGCFDRCKKTGARMLLAPIPDFDNWAWTNYDPAMAPPTLSGSGTVPDYTLTDTPGTFTLTLENSGCARESRPLYYSPESCDSCGEDFSSSVAEVIQAAEPFCHFEISLDIANTSGGSVRITATTDHGEDGLLAPATFTAGTGTHTYGFTFYPDSGFTGTVITIYFTVAQFDGTRCYFHQDVTLPGNCFEDEEPIEERPAPGYKSASLRIAPNPAGHATQIAYAFTGEGSRTVTVYDLSGRELAHLLPDAAEGEWQLDTSGYAPGYYIVVMRQGGQPIRQQKLAIE